ncbi:VOC family protein [Planococcus halocryophilus]|uniref:VOC family protein n=1 Tax=Planococcus halocryophilus TaxID=1215089 RepID=UPI001F0E4B6C|nr:VOC family protein [Planococcus halocryophilus]
MTLKAKEIYVNLSVKDLNKSVEFFKQLGFDFHPEMTDENATCMIVGDNIFVMLLTEPFFKTFTNKALGDSTKTTEVIVAISVDSRKDVNDMVNKALEAGGSTSNDPMDNEYMYAWSFQDIDGHLWEVMAMPEKKD